MTMRRPEPLTTTELLRRWLAWANTHPAQSPTLRQLMTQTQILLLQGEAAEKQRVGVVVRFFEGGPYHGTFRACSGGADTVQVDQLVRDGPSETTVLVIAGHYRLDRDAHGDLMRWDPAKEDE